MTQAFKTIAILKPCCIGDVVFSFALINALHRAYPDAAIDYFAGSMAIRACLHPALRERVNTGPHVNPASRPGSLIRLVAALRRGRYDLLVVPDRSRLYSIVALLSGIRVRAGLDSAGRGLGYTLRATIDPMETRHESDIYLDIARALGIDVAGCYADAPDAVIKTDASPERFGVTAGRYLIVHPGGGVNVGMSMVEKRWPAGNFAALAVRIADRIGPDAQPVIIGLESDRPAIDQVKAALNVSLNRPALDLSNQLSLAETAGLARQAAIYLGNDNGVAHLAAAVGARVLMIFGPSDPRRYAPFVPPTQARYVWKQVALPAHGVTGGAPVDFSWERDGVGVDQAWEQASALLDLAGYN